MQGLASFPLDHVHGRTTRVGGCNVDADSFSFHAGVANDSELDDIDERKLRVLDAAENPEDFISPCSDRRSGHHSAPGCERATICISESMWPRDAVWRPRRPPALAVGSSGIVSVPRDRTSRTMVSHFGRIEIGRAHV